MKINTKYTYEKTFGNKRHTWTAVGAKMAIHLRITDFGEKHGNKYGNQQYSSGIEMHYRTPPDYMSDDAPSQDSCWLLKCPCWHDGSSLQASKTWIPRWQADPHDHDEMFSYLEYELKQRTEEMNDASPA